MIIHAAAKTTHDYDVEMALKTTRERQMVEVHANNRTQAAAAAKRAMPGWEVCSVNMIG